MNGIEQSITVGMNVIRKTAATHPVVGIVKSLHAGNQWGSKSKAWAKVEWQDATRRTSGSTTTTSSIALDELIEATEENIADIVAKSKTVTPVMKAALSYWRETYGEQYVGLYEAASSIDDHKKQHTYRRAFEKLARLGYLEQSPDNKGKGSAHWVYRLSKKED